jgi:hypothetical protein
VAVKEAQLARDERWDGSEPVLDRAMLEWSRRCPDDGLVFGAALHIRGARPAPERVAAFLASRLGVVPSLAEHLVGPARQESWRHYDAFDPASHVIHRQVDDAGTALGEMADCQLPGDRPRWQVRLYDGWSRESYLLCYLVHHAAADGEALTRTLERLFAASSYPASSAPVPTMPGAGTRQRIASAALDVTALREAARPAGGTVHDAYLAILAGAVARDLPAGQLRGLHARVPFSFRRGEDRQDRGNLTGSVRAPLPCSEPDPAQRVARVAEWTRAWKRSGSRDRARHRYEHMSPDVYLRALPGPVSPTDSRLNATSLRFRVPLAVMGGQVTSVTSIPPRAGGHLFTSMLCTYGPVATISFISPDDTASRMRSHWRDQAAEDRLPENQA